MCISLATVSIKPNLFNYRCIPVALWLEEELRTSWIKVSSWCLGPPQGILWSCILYTLYSMNWSGWLKLCLLACIGISTLSPVTLRTKNSFLLHYSKCSQFHCFENRKWQSGWLIKVFHTYHSALHPLTYVSELEKEHNLHEFTGAQTVSFLLWTFIQSRYNLR